MGEHVQVWVCTHYKLMSFLLRKECLKGKGRGWVTCGVSLSDCRTKRELLFFRKKVRDGLRRPDTTDSHEGGNLSTSRRDETKKRTSEREGQAISHSLSGLCRLSDEIVNPFEGKGNTGEKNQNHQGKKAEKQLPREGGNTGF